MLLTVAAVTMQAATESPRIGVAQVRACASSEGLHLTGWSGIPLRSERLWHQYYYLGYDVEPDCEDADVD
jgi:hypothetical protein